MTRKNGLAWNAGKAPSGGGGFVASVGLNGPATPGLAVDPEGTVPPPRRKGREAAGPQLTVESIAPQGEDDRTTRAGRIRMLPG